MSKRSANEIDGIDVLGEEGNTDTSSPKKQQISQRMHWHFTLNNYETSDIDVLDVLFRQICTDWCFQEEIGKNGTPHLQGAIRLKRPMRYTEFTPNRRIHWEPQKFTHAYALKEATRKPNGIQKWGGSYRPEEELDLIQPTRMWQGEILDIITTKPDPRRVHWYWSVEGNVGKSSFAKYLVAKHNALFFEEGKKSDVMHLIMTAPLDRLKLIVIDVPRDNGNNVSYKSIESIKNGMIYSPKYEGGYKLFNPPHLFVFANAPPQYERLSADRWYVQRIYDVTPDTEFDEYPETEPFWDPIDLSFLDDV